MTSATHSGETSWLSLHEELILMLLNEESGYFRQVPGWNLNCAVVGAVIAELSLRTRIDTDLETLFLVDAKETGDPILDPILKEIADEPGQQNAQYWIERLAPKAESIIDSTLDRLVEMNILNFHDGEFWTLSARAEEVGQSHDSSNGSSPDFVRTRIRKVIVGGEIPDPRDIITIALVNTCDVFRFIFELDEEMEERIEFICKMDIIASSIASAVAENMAGPMLRRASLTKAIPRVPLRKLLLNRHIRTGNMPALFAELAQEFGPVFELRPPMSQPMIFLAGLKTNEWANRRGRMYLRSRDYISDFEKVYGASGVLPALDGADHFRLRKSLSPAYSRARLSNRLEDLYEYVRSFMAGWKVGDVFPATKTSRRMINSQTSQLFISVESQDVFDEITAYKERALLTKVIGIAPNFMLHTPRMRHNAKAIDVLLDRVQTVHTAAQRADAPRDFADDLLGLHATDPQFVPESNIRFTLAAAMLAGVYLGDNFSFALYAMASQPDLYARIQEEADALFGDGNPAAEDFSAASIDVTHRFLLESMRMYPIVPMSMRTVMNTCVVEDYEIPLGSKLVIAQSATHYMHDVFPEPYKFDIERYRPPRNEHHGPGYGSYGLGPHRCLGSRWMELQLAINVLLVAHHFTLSVQPQNYKLSCVPLPSSKPNGKFKLRVEEIRHEIPA